MTKKNKKIQIINFFVVFCTFCNKFCAIFITCIIILPSTIDKFLHNLIRVNSSNFLNTLIADDEQIKATFNKFLVVIQVDIKKKNSINFFFFFLCGNN